MSSGELKRTTRASTKGRGKKGYRQRLIYTYIHYIEGILLLFRIRRRPDRYRNEFISPSGGDVIIFSVLIDQQHVFHTICTYIWLYTYILYTACFITRRYKSKAFFLLLLNIFNWGKLIIFWLLLLLSYFANVEKNVKLFFWEMWNIVFL